MILFYGVRLPNRTLQKKHSMSSRLSGPEKWGLDCNIWGWYSRERAFAGEFEESLKKERSKQRRYRHPTRFTASPGARRGKEWRSSESIASQAYTMSQARKSRGTCTPGFSTAWRSAPAGISSSRVGKRGKFGSSTISLPSAMRFGWLSEPLKVTPRPRKPAMSRTYFATYSVATPNTSEIVISRDSTVFRFENSKLTFRHIRDKIWETLMTGHK